MKEIKFRVWDKEEKKFRKLVRFINSESEGIIAIELREHGVTSFLDLNGCVLLQYTGLKDKNGKEIYEGDINKNNRDFLYVITWHPSMCAFVQLQWGHTFSDGDFLDMRFNFHEVIGNIYENPELREREV